MGNTSSRCSPPTVIPFLGGEDFDRRLIDSLADEFKKDNGMDLRVILWRCSVLRRLRKKPRLNCHPVRKPRSICLTSRLTRAARNT
ncbi:MAG: hypothetical protein CM1200mP20_17240 [Pseudomonadota bacterium]|nr:MAG: hypothetical protein CM1200mP20_17240 [Pseudomonadota bacterium]